MSNPAALVATPLPPGERENTELPNDPSPSVTIRSNAARYRLPNWIRSTKLGSGILNDIRSRAPYYKSDWTDAWNYRVIPATTLIFFSKCVYCFHNRDIMLTFC